MESKEVVLEKLSEFVEDLRQFAAKTQCGILSCEECPVGKKLCEAIVSNLPPAKP